jgi:hypothetical protein
VTANGASFLATSSNTVLIAVVDPSGATKDLNPANKTVTNTLSISVIDRREKSICNWVAAGRIVSNVKTTVAILFGAVVLVGSCG